MHSKTVNLVTVDVHSPSLEGGCGSEMARNSISTAGHALQSCPLTTDAFSQETEAWVHQKMVWTARCMKNKTRLSAGGQTDREQVYPWHAEGVVSSTMPQTCSPVAKQQ